MATGEGHQGGRQLLTRGGLRATIQRATNKSGSIHNFARWIAFGNAGIIPTNNRREMSKYLKYHHLLANITTFANVALSSQAMKGLVSEGHSFTPDAVAVLIPDFIQHIIRFGLYRVDRKRQARPLMYEVPILIPEDALEVANVVVGAG
jgi:Tn3 transposase DDE domain